MNESEDEDEVTKQDKSKDENEHESSDYDYFKLSKRLKNCFDILKMKLLQRAQVSGLY